MDVACVETTKRMFVLLAHFPSYSKVSLVRKRSDRKPALETTQFRVCVIENEAAGFMPIFNVKIGNGVE